MACLCEVRSNADLNILVIKLGALGDFVQATTAFAALRAHHPNTQLTLLTTAPYVDFAKRLGFFDHILIDSRPKWYQWTQIRSLVKSLRQGQFDCVVDLQGVDRTRLYKRLFPRSTRWIDHPSSKDLLHPQDRFRDQLQAMGIHNLPTLDLTFLAEPYPVGSSPYALLIPGASNAHGGRKKWPEENYAALAQYLLGQRIQPVIIGGPGESFPVISQQAPGSLNLVGKTSFYQVIGLAQKALFAIGNDTGPMLLAASGGCPTLTLYSSVNPATIGGAKGPKNLVIEEDDLNNLGVKSVIEKLNGNMITSQAF